MPRGILRRYLAYQDAFVASALDGLANEFLGAAIAVHFGCINQTCPNFQAQSQRRDFLLAHRGIISHAPCPKPERWHSFTFWQSDSLHEWRLVPNLPYRACRV